MTTSEARSELRRRILAGYPALLLRTFEESRWEEELQRIAAEVHRPLTSWSVTSGPQPPIDSELPPGDILGFLDLIGRMPGNRMYLMKDLHAYLDDPRITRKIRDLIPQLTEQRTTLLLMSPLDQAPEELAKDMTQMHLPLPGADEIRSQLQAWLESVSRSGSSLRMTPRDEDRIVQGALGLTLSEARHAFAKVLMDRDEMSDDVFVQLVAEKRHLIQGSNLLEFFDLEEGLEDIGGLEALKDWIQERSTAFSSQARMRGISNPKGVLLAGVQGCGKSLSAKVIARILGFPLVRLDIGALLDSARGSSEQNLRNVLQLMETISPAVLWLEEIDKAFAGLNDDSNADATMSRIMARFLTWLQEHTSPVFVVATANNVAGLPPEMLRRGRFDELFFVDLPNYHERLSIFKIHLSKRGWNPEKFHLDELASDTDGYSGAEIEQIVNSAIIESHAHDRVLAQEDLATAREQTVPLSVTMEDDIFRLREWARVRCRPATLDHRVIQVLEEEERRGELPDLPEVESPRWIQLAELGQLASAVVEYVRLHDHVTWSRLLQDLETYSPCQGEYGIALRSDPKIVVWLRMSRALADVFCEYIDGKRLYLHPMSIDELPSAGRLQLPTVDRLPDSRVDQPVWFPTRLRLIPPAGGSNALSSVVRIRMGRSRSS